MHDPADSKAAARELEVIGSQAFIENWDWERFNGSMHQVLAKHMGEPVDEDEGSACEGIRSPCACGA